MPATPTSWTNHSPGDLRIALPNVHATPPGPAIEAATRAALGWARTPLTERAALLRAIRDELQTIASELASTISLEMGKPLTEARGELTAVIAKFDLTLSDADRHLASESVTDGPHPSERRQLARGPAAVIGPFNFPLHLANGAILAHLAAGNPVLFKPSPVTPVVAARYAEVFLRHLPPGVFGLVQGGAAEGQTLCTDPRVRAICFTGSVAAGRAISRAIADDYTKNLALELGGKNALIVCPDADLAAAAQAAADGLCLTAGQRCNATTRIILHREISAAFIEQFLTALAAWSPADPLLESTKLGPLATAAAHDRYAATLQRDDLPWLLRGTALATRPTDGAPGHYVTPSVLLWENLAAGLSSPFTHEELFAPLVEIFIASNDAEILALHNATPYGLTASIYTRSRAHFESLAAGITVGNLYANLPTTFSPSALPFGGLALSGNGKPGGRHFIRFTTDEQSVQIPAGSLSTSGVCNA